MSSLGFAQLFFALIAVLGMIYIERTRERNERHENNKKNLQFNLIETLDKADLHNIGNSNPNAADTEENIKCFGEEFSGENITDVKKAIKESGSDMLALKKLYKKISVVFNKWPSNLEAAKDCIDADKNHSEDVVLQNRLLMFPYILIFIFCMAVLWIPFFGVKISEWFIKCAQTFVFSYSSISVAFLVGYPVSPGKWRSFLKWVVFYLDREEAGNNKCC